MRGRGPGKVRGNERSGTQGGEVGGVSVSEVKLDKLLEISVSRVRK